jgi:hypothetical protein
MLNLLDLLWNGLSITNFGPLPPVTNLTPLTLSSNTFPSPSVQGTPIGIIGGYPPGAALSIKGSPGGAVQLFSTLVIVPGGFQIQWQLQVGLSPPPPSSFLVTITQSYPGSINSPFDTIFSITVLGGTGASSALPLGVP